jgi:hypothetical protein
MAGYANEVSVSLLEDAWFLLKIMAVVFRRKNTK